MRVPFFFFLFVGEGGGQFHFAGLNEVGPRGHLGHNLSRANATEDFVALTALGACRCTISERVYTTMQTRSEAGGLMKRGVVGGVDNK